MAGSPASVVVVALRVLNGLLSVCAVVEIVYKKMFTAEAV